MVSTYLLSSLAALGTLLSTASASASASTAALVVVPDFGYNPTNLTMNIYVPNNLRARPAVILALHGCFATAEDYVANTNYTSLAAAHNFVVIYPHTPHDSFCWDVARPSSLTHDGHGDSHGLANMVRYAAKKYCADPRKLFVTGTSSGAMMTAVLSATYPDIFAAASGYSGVAAGCLAGSPGSSPFSADWTCANGDVRKTQAEWVAVAQAMYPGWNGPYPRMQVWHGTADALVSYPNLAELVKQWSGLHWVSFTRNETDVPQLGYTKMVFGDGRKFVAYSAEGVGHVVPAHEKQTLEWFGI